MSELAAIASTRESIYTNVLIQRVVRADVWLRMVASGAIPISEETAGAGVVGTPTYERRELETARGIEG